MEKYDESTTSTQTRDNIVKLVYYIDPAGNRTWNLRDGDTVKSVCNPPDHKGRQYWCDCLKLLLCILQSLYFED